MVMMMMMKAYIVNIIINSTAQKEIIPKTRIIKIKVTNVKVTKVKIKNINIL